MHRPKYRPRRLEGVVFGAPDKGGRAVVASPTGANFQVGAKEVRLIELADGTRTVGEITDRLGEELGTQFNPDDVAFAVAQLADYGVIGRNPGQRVPRQVASQRSIFRVVRPLTDPSRWLARHTSAVRLAGGPVGLIVVLASAFAGGAFLALRFDRLPETFASLATVSSAPRYALAWAIALLTFALHEVAHAVVAARFGARVRQMGVMLLFFQPCLYTDASDAWRLTRAARFWISMAGVLANVFFIGILVVAWALVGPWLGGVFLLAATFIAFSTVVNLNPLMPFDGYFALMDLVGVTNLRQQGMAALVDVVHRRGADERRVKDRRGLYLTFGAVSLTYTALAIVLIAYIAVSLLGYLLGAAAILAMLAAGIAGVRRDFVVRGWGRRVPRRPVVRPGVLGRRLPGGDKELFTQTGESVRLEGDGGLADRLLPQLDGRPVRSVAKSLGVPARRVHFLLRPLTWSGFLTEAPSDADTIEERYDRNLVLLSHLDSGNPWKAQGRLCRSKVAVVGAPGWCEWVALELCAAGVAGIAVHHAQGEPQGEAGGPPFPKTWLARFRPDAPVRYLDSREIVDERPDLIVLGCPPPSSLRAWAAGNRIPALRAGRTGAAVELACLDGNGAADAESWEPCPADDLASSGVAAIEAVRMLLGAGEPAAHTVLAPGG